MAFRITTNGMFHAYNTSLSKANSKLQNSMNGVSTHRAFSTYAEDPNAASKAFQLRRNMWRTNDQINTSRYLITKYETGYNALSSIVDGDAENPGLDGLVDSLTAMSDTSGNARKSLGQDLIAKSESIALDMNIRNSEEYVFAGSDGLNPPFQWVGDTLTYRGIDVNARTGTDNYRKLQSMAEEKIFVDIGLGIQEDPDDHLIESSAFNSSLSGLDFLNYGVDADGDPKNLAVMMRQLGNILLRTDSTGNFANSRDAETAERLSAKLSDAVSHTQEQHVRMSAETNYLRTNMEQLSDTKTNLNEEVENLEQKEPAEAIMEMYWAQYCYQASLKIGTDLLSQSLFDYLS